VGWKGTKTKIHQELVLLIGVENTLKVLKKYGGRSIWIPRPDAFLTHRRNVRIYKEYIRTGLSMRELGERWSLRKGTIQKIIGAIRSLPERSRK